MTDKTRNDAISLIQRYYERFNAGDWNAMLALLTDDVVHDLNQGGREVGKDAFTAFLARMNRCYRERIDDLVVMTGEGDRGRRRVGRARRVPRRRRGAAAGARPALHAAGRRVLRAARRAHRAGHELPYNLQDWLRQVQG